MASKCLTTFAMVLMLVGSGCTRSGDGDKPPTASIPATTDSNQSPAAQKTSFDSQHPVVQIQTSQGNITLRLFRDKSPTTVTNFLRYMSEGHYNDTIVHQVYRGQGFLAGGYGSNLVEKPTRTPIWNEARNGSKNRRGTVAMARLPDDKDSATCQFFVNVADNPDLDHRNDTPEGYGYCVFGEIEDKEGLDVLDRIAAAPVHNTPAFERTPVEKIVITSIRQVR